MTAPHVDLSRTVVSVTGLGYVGLPVAVAMSSRFRTIGFDVNETRIDELRRGVDRTREVDAATLAAGRIEWTSDVAALAAANFHVVAVPTPVTAARQPDLSLVLKASASLGGILKRGDLVVYESTVYPGATEEECVPVLERISGLRCGPDFAVGYSPERINPGDREHSFTRIRKVVSAMDAESLARVSAVYGAVVTAGVHEASSIKVAEAAKVIENTQRDLNIALMNELALIFERLGIDTLAVLEAASTKWNFLPFRPGLVGGHCIGVDPYYLTHVAQRIGYHPEVILAGRRINDGMGRVVAQRTLKAMIGQGMTVKGSTVTVLGLTFKENVPDLRNTRVVDIIDELEAYGVRVQVCDPEADPEEARHEHGLELTPFARLAKAQAVIVAVAHEAFRRLELPDYLALLGDRPVIMDVKGIVRLPAGGAPDGLALLRT